ncbi:MAG: transposase [Neisseriales bacterium]|nr:MAG: transposase [Neisseriales bacterium]
MYPKPEIFNTNQGSCFTAQAFIDVLRHNRISISMDGCGRVLDNIFIERFWRSLKQEKIYLLELNSLADTKTPITELWIFTTIGESTNH